MLHWEIMGLRASIALLMLVGVAITALLGYQATTPTETLQAGSVTVEIPAHDGLMEIAGRLHQAGAIRNRAGFVVLAAVRGTTRRLKAGEYEIDRGATTVDVLSQLEAGRVKQHLVLQPEGATITELARVLEAEHLAPSATIHRLAADPAFLSTLGVEAPSLEGYLFPDTYQFVRGMTGEEMLARMVQRLRAKMGADITARAAARGLTVHQLLTLASIIEREAVERDEMRKISAVFWNRLKLRMPLQADPTVQYATGKERRALTRADLRVDHPYNTYRYPGLPPGPIASPGLAAIEATLDPAPVNYLYFVAMDDTHHHFSATIAEHNAAVARYRLAHAR